MAEGPSSLPLFTYRHYLTDSLTTKRYEHRAGLALAVRGHQHRADPTPCIGSMEPKSPLGEGGGLSTVAMSMFLAAYFGLPVTDNGVRG